MTTTLHQEKRASQRTVTLLVGPIASGKSTYIPKMPEGVITINDDAIYLACHGGDYSKYDKRLKPLYKSIEDHMLHMALALGRDVVIDRPNLTRASRARYVSIAQALDVGRIRAVVFPIEDEPIRHALRRIASDNRGQTPEFWEKCALDQVDRYETVLWTEGFTEIEHL